MYRASVTRVNAAGVWLVCPLLLAGVEFGPCQYVGDAPAAGEAVLVADLGDAVSPDLVVIGVMS